MIRSLLYFLVIGLIAGYLASRLMGVSSSDVGKNLITGIVGSFVGGFIGNLIGLQASGLIGSILLAVVGACVSIWIFRRFIAR
ncbi:MAG: GlsB/YeaQ/YmgE family stress response membrane protein [Solobacterium sp.]|nr:GlsB/YeaQ/YmgE family stress response membrane protein [Solobacterium sp.]